MSNAEQQDLVQRAVLGDRDAVSKLLRLFGPDVEAGLKISSTWRGRLDTADVMQITYLEAFLHIRKFDPARAASFSAWLRRMADNNLRDAIRGLETKKNQPFRMQLDAFEVDSTIALFEALTIGTSTPSRGVGREEAAGRLRDSMQLLPPDYARVIQLYDLEGSPVEEVARCLGRSTGAVHMLRMRGHDRLRELLGGRSHFFDSRS